MSVMEEKYNFERNSVLKYKNLFNQIEEQIKKVIQENDIMNESLNQKDLQLEESTNKFKQLQAYLDK